MNPISGEPAIVRGDADASTHMIARITSEDESERMPPEGDPVTPAEAEVLRRSDRSGANWDKHWAFKPMARNEPPAVDDAQWSRHPIDAFVFHSLAVSRLEAESPCGACLADPSRVLRPDGTTSDRHGTKSKTSSAIPMRRARLQKLIDRLLESPHYGEKWGRHWLDLVRYAETNSYERDGAKPFVWRYRDYVIQSFNDDKPYDQFVIEQLAGDELQPPTPDSLIATGYYRLGRWDDEPVDPELAFYDDVDDIITTTGQTFLGLTINCGACHDHKIDPMPQRDYYRMLAFFRNIRRLGCV